MFMVQENQEENKEAPVRKYKKAANKAVKSKVKAKPKKSVKAEKPKVASKKVTKSPAKKAVKPKVIKPKSYKVSGTFNLGADGKILKQTKSIKKIAVSNKEIVVTFTVKRK